jgi:hypothetical protein
MWLQPMVQLGQELVQVSPVLGLVRQELVQEQLELLLPTT